MTGTNKSKPTASSEEIIFSELGRVHDLLGQPAGGPAAAEDLAFADKPLQESAFTQQVLLELEALQYTLTAPTTTQPPSTNTVLTSVKSNSAKAYRRGLKEVQTCLFDDLFGDTLEGGQPAEAEAKKPKADSEDGASPNSTAPKTTPKSTPAQGSVAGAPQAPSGGLQFSSKVTEDKGAASPTEPKTAELLAPPTATEPTPDAKPKVESASSTTANSTQIASSPSKSSISPAAARTSLFSPLRSKPGVIGKAAKAKASTVSEITPAAKPPATSTPTRAKADQSQAIDRMVDDLVAQYLPEIEQRLRQQLKRLLDK